MKMLELIPLSMVIFGKVFLFSLIIIGIGMLFFCVKILLKKNGRFPNTHVSGSKEMRKRGIGCVQSQDAAMRRKSPHAVSERSK